MSVYESNASNTQAIDNGLLGFDMNRAHLLPRDHAPPQSITDEGDRDRLRSSARGNEMSRRVLSQQEVAARNRRMVAMKNVREKTKAKQDAGSRLRKDLL